MLDRTLEFDDLKRLTGYARMADVERCLTSQGIRFFRGRDGIWTTIDLVNQAGGLAASASEADPYAPELAA